MRKLHVLFLSFLLFAVGSCAEDAAPPTEPGSRDIDLASPATVDVVVVLDRSFAPGGHAANQARAAEIARELGVAPAHAYGTAVFGFSGAVPAGRLNALERDPRVASVERDRAWELAVQDLPTGIDRIETDRNPDAAIDGADNPTIGHDVAIIDTGILGSHGDLNVAGGINFANGPSQKWDDGNGHGTHVAGTVGAIDNGSGVVGVAPGAPVWAVRVCGNSGFCFTSDMVAGIDWVADRKASGQIDFASANMSISTGDDSNPCPNQGSSGSAIHDAICGVVDEGVVFVIAAGNNDREKDAFPEAVAVSALADFDGIGGALGSPTCRNDEDDTLANFSNFGPEVDIAAPGVCILSTWNDGGTAVISGTSMAAPHVTGAVALYLHANGLAPAQDAGGVGDIRTAIEGSALPQNDPCGYTNEHAGAGSDEPLLFVNATAFGGDGSCDDGSGGGGGGDTPPNVDITNPADGATVSGTITVAADASDDNGVTQVEFFVDGTTSIGIDENGGDGWSIEWNTEDVADGSHDLTATATDDAGQEASDTISVTVDNVAEAAVSVDTIDPNSMLAGETIGVTITGSGFQSGASVAFENGSGPAPEATVNGVSGDGTTIDATVSAKSGGPPGDRVWDVRVTNSDASTGVLPGGFTVTR